MNWLKRTWLKFKAWFVAMLILIGLITIPPLYSAPRDLSWTNPTERVDTTPFDAATEQLETRIYCDGDISPTLVVPGDATSATLDFSVGSHSCEASVVDTDNQESDRSNQVTFDILPARPNPPVLSVN